MTLYMRIEGTDASEAANDLNSALICEKSPMRVRNTDLELKEAIPRAVESGAERYIYTFAADCGPSGCDENFIKRMAARGIGISSRRRPAIPESGTA